MSYNSKQNPLNELKMGTSNSKIHSGSNRPRGQGEALCGVHRGFWKLKLNLNLKRWGVELSNKTGLKDWDPQISTK